MKHSADRVSSNRTRPMSGRRKYMRLQDTLLVLNGRQDNPLGPQHSRMREIDRDLIRGEHYGQRSCEPHTKAERMAAPTKPAT